MDQSTRTINSNSAYAYGSKGSQTPPLSSAEAVLNRSMPESLEAEAAVLGSMALDAGCIGQVIQQIKADDFYRIGHQLIFEALISLWEQKEGKVDFLLLRDELKKGKHLEEVGGAEYLVKIANAVPSSANVEHYVEIVKEKAMMRELIAATGEILSEAFDQGGDIGTKLDEAEKKIFAITQKKITGAAVPISNLLTQAFENIDKREGHHVTGLPTGFAELDELTCGLQKNEMIIIAGRPSMGKTSFAMNVAEYMGADSDLPVVIFSLEMSDQQLAERMLCSRGMVDSQLVRKGMLDSNHYDMLVQTAGEMSNKPIYVDDTPGLTPLELRGKARRLKSQYDIQCIFIDYLQLMSVGGRVESRQQEVSVISRYLKALARELEIPVVVLSQLNRASEGREGHRPRMSDLRESGSLEQDADVVMLLHREDYYHRGEEAYEDTNTAELIIAKQRNGPTGIVELVFDGKFTRFKTASNVGSTF